MQNQVTITRYYQDHKSSVIRDLLGVLVCLSLGIGGQRFLSNPAGIFTPDLPMLSRDDVPNSATTPVYEDSQSGSLSQQREFHVTIILGEEGQMYRDDSWFTNQGATILQKALWYADPAEAVLDWKWRESRIKNEFSNIPPIESNSLSEHQAASALYCSDQPNNRRICVYVSYWKHWYTEIRFLSGGDEYLSFADVQDLSSRATELLMSAPDRP